VTKGKEKKERVVKVEVSSRGGGHKRTAFILVLLKDPKPKGERGRTKGGKVGGEGKVGGGGI